MTVPGRAEAGAAAALLVLMLLGLLDVLVLLPAALAPSTPLPRVWAAVAAIGDPVPVLAGPVVWALLCAALAVRHVLRRRAAPALRVVGVALVQAGLLAVLQQAAAFGAGLWLSNHLPPFEGGTTALGDALLLLGLVATAAGALLLGVGAVRHRSRRTSASA